MNGIQTAIAGALFLAATLGGADANSQPPGQQQRINGAAAAGPKAKDSSVLVAQPTVRVNTTTAGQQVLETVGPLADGGYSVAWVTDETTLSMQRYDSAGTKVGGEVLGPEGASAASILSNGDLVVAYSTVVTQSQSGSFQVFIQMFDPSGEQLRGETLVFSLSYALRRPSVLTDTQLVPLADGGFVVGWQFRSFGSVDVTHFFLTQRFDAQGQAVGDPLTVGSGSAIAGTDPASYTLVPDAHGGYVVTRDGTGRVRGFSADHYSPNKEVSVAGMPNKVILLPLEDETYVLFASDSSGAYRQALDEAGRPGAKTRLPSIPVAARELADGSYVLFWAANGQVTGQRFSADGQALGGVFAVQTRGAIPQVASLADGGFALAWTEARANGDQDAYTQRFVETPDKKNAAKQTKKKACLQSAKGTTGQARKQFMDACVAR